MDGPVFSKSIHSGIFSAGMKSTKSGFRHDSLGPVGQGVPCRELRTRDAKVVELKWAKACVRISSMKNERRDDSRGPDDDDGCGPAVARLVR
jgi:hypothetical protein